MTSLSVPLKTPDGVAELSNRQRKLSQRHRTVLLLVDGRRPEAMVRQMAVLAGADEAYFDELVGLGLIAVPQPVPEAPPEPTVVDEAVDAAEPASIVTPPPEPEPEPAGLMVAPDSIASALPPSLTLPPESVLLTDSMMSESPISGLTPLTELGDILEEARGILMRAVRAEAPVSGSLTMLRLRRARSRDDIEALLDEIEARITKPNKSLWATQTIGRARELLHSHAVQSMPMPFA